MEKKIGEKSGRDCSKCGAPLVYRRNRRTGNTFEGCSNFFKTKCAGKIGAPRGKSKTEGGDADPESDSAEVVADAEITVRPIAAEPVEQQAIVRSGPEPTGAGVEIYNLVRRFVIGDVEAATRMLIAQEVAKIGAGAVTIEWRVNDVKLGEIKGKTHKALSQIMRRIKAGHLNIFVAGPTGSGKTTLAQQVAEALNRPYASVSCTAGMPEWHLLGRALPNLQDGTTNYEISRFVHCYENGGIFLLDEGDAADPNVLIVLHEALSNGHMNVPARIGNTVAKRHPDFVLIFAANTWGNGANRVYVGRNQLDGATRSRFACAKVFIDYDRELESAIASAYLTMAGAAAALLSRFWSVRSKVEELKLQQPVGTRELTAICKTIASGESVETAFDDLATDWTPDERSKCGIKSTAN